jgi:uncharacterized membrane protein YbhN (UPF0104 family)
MSTFQVHVVCLGLIAADFVARAFRIQWILAGLHARITFRNAVTLNAFGDAACALTPLRIGGEPARLGGMLRAGVPAPAAFVAISVEVLAAWPVIIVAAGVLLWFAGAAWWAVAEPRLTHGAARAWPWLTLLVVASGIAWHLAGRLRISLRRLIERPLRRARVYWRRMPLWPLLASVPCTMIDLGARVAILPVLAQTLPAPPPAGPLWLGSFALLYVQLLLPTPSGAGAVELGFLGGAAGELGGQEAPLLLAWRFYTSGVGLIVGAWLAVRIYGWPAIRGALRRITTG